MNRLPRHLKRVRLAAHGMAEGYSRRHRKVLHSESGAVLVEFALAASVLLCLLFAVIQFGYALFTFQYVNELARELTRYSVVRGSDCVGMPNCGFTDSSTTLQTYAQSAYRFPGIDTTKLAITATWYAPSTTAQNPTWSTCSGTGCNVPGNLVKVTVQYPFSLSIPFWRATLLNVTSSSAMVISQ